MIFSCDFLKCFHWYWFVLGQYINAFLYIALFPRNHSLFTVFFPLRDAPCDHESYSGDLWKMGYWHHYEIDYTMIFPNYRSCIFKRDEPGKLSHLTWSILHKFHFPQTHSCCFVLCITQEVSRKEEFCCDIGW